MSTYYLQFIVILTEIDII